ncbi:MAG: LPS export ABC transporter ATP-binding protein [Planctomycetes bacterium]|nr:LPS export ABC transporter ATP-binding protein [Planctomycetota bacterium]
MPLLEVRGLIKNYGRRRVVDGVSFQVNPGEVVGLLGPNGAGKTTSFRMTTGQISPNAGEVWFNGSDVTYLPMYKRARLGMGYLSQETSVFRKLTVEQNILAILEIMPAMRTLGRKLTKQERKDRTEQVLHQFGLTHVRTNYGARLSGGEKRRLEIARCLVSEPLLILLDEPFTGIDPKTIADIQDIVRDLRSQGIGLLLTDHNVREALKITTRSYLIKDGKVRTHGTPAEIVNDPIAINEYLGKSFNEAIPGMGTPYPRYEQAPAATSISIESAPPARGTEPAIYSVLEQEKIHRLVEGLKTPDHALAAAELEKRGPGVTPALLAALERRDVEMRRLALQVLQNILKRPVAFDPFAPEVLRKQQLASLREQFERKAG